MPDTRRSTADPEAHALSLDEQQALRQRAIRGDAAAFEALVMRRGEYLYALARAHLGDRHLAEDAVQEALLLAWKHIATLRDGGAFDAWIGTIVIRECNKVRENRTRQKTVALDQVSVEPRAATAPAQGGNPLWEALASRITLLEPSHQVLLALRYSEGLPVDQIAQRLGLNEATVRGRLYHVREKLRDAVKRGRHDL